MGRSKHVSCKLALWSGRLPLGISWSELQFQLALCSKQHNIQQPCGSALRRRWAPLSSLGSAACICFGMDKLCPLMSTFSLLSADLQPSYLPTISLTFWPGKRAKNREDHPTNCSSFTQFDVKFHLSCAFLHLSRPTQKRCVWHLSRMLGGEREVERDKDLFARCPGDSTARAVTQDRTGGRVEFPL